MTGIKFILSTSAYSLFICFDLWGVCFGGYVSQNAARRGWGQLTGISSLFHHVGPKDGTQVAKFSVLAANAPSLRACSLAPCNYQLN